jgi:hypothetical protein
MQCPCSEEFQSSSGAKSYHVISTGNDIVVVFMASTTAKAQPEKISFKIYL